MGAESVCCCRAAVVMTGSVARTIEPRRHGERSAARPNSERMRMESTVETATRKAREKRAHISPPVATLVPGYQDDPGTRLLPGTTRINLDSPESYQLPTK